MFESCWAFFDDEIESASVCWSDDGSLVLGNAVGNLIGGLVGGHVDPEKLEQMPVLFTYTTASLAIATLILVALIIPIRRMMKC